MKDFWNRDDNISLSKHCEAAGVEYKRCIAHNQPMRALDSAEKRNKLADEQIAKFQEKLKPRSAQGAAPGTSVEVKEASKVKELEEKLEKEKEKVEKLEDELAQKDDEIELLTAQVEASKKPKDGVDWEQKYTNLFKAKHDAAIHQATLLNAQLNEMRKMRDFIQSLGAEWLDDIPEDYPVMEPLKEGWEVKHKKLIGKLKVLPQLQEE